MAIRMTIAPWKHPGLKKLVGSTYSFGIANPIKVEISTAYALRSRWSRLFVGLLCVGLFSLSGCERSKRDTGPSSTSADSKAEFQRLVNLGKAFLENRDSKLAIENLEKAVQLDDSSPVTLRNLARAYRLARDWPKALATLEKADRLESDSVATQYLLGLVRIATAETELAAQHFARAVQLDPNNAVLRFQLARASELLKDTDKTIEQLNETLRLDPLHASAQFKLMRFARQAGDTDEFQKRNREFQRLRKLFGDDTRTAQALEECSYTAPEAIPTTTSRPNARDRIGVKFVPSSSSTIDDVTAVAYYRHDDQHQPRFVAINAEGALSTVSFSPELAPVRVPIEGLSASTKQLQRCIVGNFHDDVPQGKKYDPKVHAHDDLLLFGTDGLRVLKHTAENTFTDVTATTGLSDVSAMDAEWVDYEHDGDLDLLVANESGIQIWQNNGDATFINVTADIGIQSLAGAIDILSIDLDQDVATDIVSAFGAQSTVVYENQRAGMFSRMSEPPLPWPASKLLAAEDLNNDGYPDVVCVSENNLAVLFPQSRYRWTMDFDGMVPHAIALFDYDNDGWVDLLLAGGKADATESAGTMLFRNSRDNTFEDTTFLVGLADLQIGTIRDAITTDVDIDGDSDLLFVSNDDRLNVLLNNGGNVNRQLKLELTTLKTNTTGLGTHIELRSGTEWITRAVRHRPIEIGVGQLSALDSLQTVWTNGVVDNQVNVDIGDTPITVEEKNVAAGSCPFLYAWDGNRFQFVTDLLGNSPIGLPISREKMIEADIDEIVVIGGEKEFRPRNGAYEVVVTDEFREVLYLDVAELLVVDHPNGLEVHTTDKLMPPPFPKSEVWTLGARRSLKSATGSDGKDRTAAVAEIDGGFSEPGVALPSPYRGMGEPLSITLDFGPLDEMKIPVLAMTGWLQYGDASTNIAMSQNSGLTIIPPMLEVEASDGTWHPIDIIVGMPAGKTKTILCDLKGQLPQGAMRLRLTTTFELRWDRIALFERIDTSGAVTHRLRPMSADLQWRGFSEIKQRKAGHPTTPDFVKVSQTPPWRTTLEGWCTRYGDVLELVTRHDDKLALVNSGDAITLSFDATKLPPVPEHHTRTFFFYSLGWDKDGDHNVAGGDTVEPMPWSLSKQEPVDAEQNWQVEYNTRWVREDQFRPRK